MKPLCDIPRRMFAAGSKRHLGDLGATAIVLVLLMKDLPCDGWSMTLGETMISVWQQSPADGKDEVQLAGESFPATVFRAKKLRSVEFMCGELRIMGIE